MVFLVPNSIGSAYGPLWGDIPTLLGFIIRGFKWDIPTLLTFIIRGFILDIPILTFASVLFWGLEGLPLALT